MVNRFSRWYRAMATGIGYLVFGLGTAMFSLVLCLNPEGATGPSLRRRRRQFASLAFRFFLGYLKWTGVLRDVEYVGEHHIPEDGSCTFVVNHPTLLDPIFMVAHLRFVDCIVMSKHLRFFKYIARWLDYMPDPRSTELFEECVTRLENGRNLLFFPEGTRSPRGGLRTFTRVHAQVILAADCQVVPALIECNHHTFRKDESWYEVPPEPLHVKITYFEPFEAEVGEGPFSERSRELTEQLRAFYKEKLPIEKGDDLFPEDR